MTAPDKITILFATRNRAGSLRRTLESLTRLKPSTIPREVVVVDNGSSDGTQAVLREFENRLDLVGLQDPVPGKSHALNHALCTSLMGEIVAFIDDDVTPAGDWIDAVLECCERWPKHSVFGGKITPVLGGVQRSPGWAMHDAIQTLAFAKHDLGNVDVEYSANQDPFGCNFWVRREAIGGTRFLEGIGPQPRQRMLGSETQFLRSLRAKGYRPLYTPTAAVEHHIEEERVTKHSVYRRARQGGRGVVHTRGLPETELLQRSRVVWHLNRIGGIARAVVEHALAVLQRDEDRRVLNTVYASWALSENVEAMRVARRHAHPLSAYDVR
jgi:glycosyltransferase involved in cell wall biosynthesis